MKNFILAINKYKKWIVLGLSLITLLLFCFPFSYASIISQNKTPFFIGVFIGAHDIIKDYNYDINSPSANDNMTAYMENWSIYKPLLLWRIIPLMMLIIVICAIMSVCLILNFKQVSFPCLSFLIPSFSAYIIQGIAPLTKSFTLSPIAIIFLILLILDIVYLVLERKCLKEVKQEGEPEEVVKTF